MKTVIFGLTSLLFTVAAVSILNCNGTRVRTDDLNITADQVNANLTSLSTMSIQSTGTSFSTMLTSFLNIRNDPNSTLYYAEAPSNMGSSPYTIADFGTNWAALSPAPPVPVTRVQIYFIVNGDATQAGLIIAAAGQQTVAPSPVPSATPSQSGAPISYAYIAINDGTSGMMAGNFSDTDYQVEMNANGTDDITLQTFDLTNGDLTDTVQVNIIHTQDQAYMGKFNVTIPQ